ncbi:MAG: family 16 glycosylhydrolase, partial [Actinobacteria bacterium]|nr:family 16 glycosylhydrolase [Actinomycetota bacterium]
MKTQTKIRATVASLALITVLFSAVSADATSPRTAAPVKERILWTQSFNEKAGTKVDPKVWSYNTGAGGWGNNEQQFYTSKAANISTDGKGSLVISAVKLDVDDPKNAYITNWCIDCVYSSARVMTKDKIGFKYGSISARIQNPEGVGMWPAFWMLGAPRASCDGWPSCGEIDIVEARGSQPYHSVSSLHGPDYSGGSAISHYYFSGNTALTAGYHTYRVDWLPNSIKFYVDNKFVGGETKTSLSPR